MLVVASYTIVMQRKKFRDGQALRNRDSDEQITRGVPLEMEFPVQRNLHPARDSQEAVQSMSSGIASTGGHGGPLHQSENERNIPLTSRTLNEPFHHEGRRSSITPHRIYPEALYHDPVMAYYIYESADPHLRNIGHEYQDNLFPLTSFDEKSRMSRGSSEIVYGHARYLSNSVVSNIPSDEIIYYHGGGIQCDCTDYNTGEKSDSMV
ncbi:unnamed protein product [Phytomonas sp. EM1]|nr:unnamed protein product [Phytomonas sp. EM1]|eukprot:CCW65605.1 unnamed protein product [Phytomonas sp. isolate EM1]